MHIIITWVSGSWKTTLWDLLIKEGFNLPINFSTREPRDDTELDNYIFISKENFLKKLSKWDFIEYTYYNNNFYWISKYIKENTIFILTPSWREILKESFERNNIEYKEFYIEIPIETQIERLKNRGDTDISNRLLDNKFFSPSPKSIILNWLNTPEYLVKVIIWQLKKI